MVIRSHARRALSLTLTTALSLAGIGCGDDEPPKKAERRDSGVEDRDASEMDASMERDAGMVPDTGSPDDGLDGTCAIDSNKIMSITQRDEPFLGMPLAVDPMQSTFALPFIGLNAGCLDVVNLTTLKGGSMGGDPTTKVAIDRCATVKEAAAASVAGQWFVATVDNRVPPHDVWVQRYDPMLAERGDAVRVSSASATEISLAIARLREGDRAIVAWSDESNGGNAIWARALDSDGNPVAEPMRIDAAKDMYYRSLTLAPLGAAGAGLAYWRYNADFSTSELVFRALDDSGSPARDAWLVATNVGPSASIDVATDPMVGGVVYSRAEGTVGREVWFQRIDDKGDPLQLLGQPGRAPALRVVDPPNKGIDVSVAKLRAGYVVTYRALPSIREARAAIRVYFLDSNGAVIGHSDVSYTSEAGGRTAVEVANDGRAVIGWSQVNPDGKSELKLVRVPCLGG